MRISTNLTAGPICHFFGQFLQRLPTIDIHLILSFLDKSLGRLLALYLESGSLKQVNDKITEKDQFDLAVPKT